MRRLLRAKEQTLIRISSGFDSLLHEVPRWVQVRCFSLMAESASLSAHEVHDSDVAPDKVRDNALHISECVDVTFAVVHRTTTHLKSVVQDLDRVRDLEFASQRGLRC
jgi:hypothetical protein